MEFIFFYRYGTIMRQVLKTPNLNWCDVVGSSKLNPLYNEVFKVIQNVEPSFVHPCPYNDFIIKNRVPDVSKLPSIFSAGYYKFLVNANDMKDKLIFNITTILEWISSERNSFG